MAALIGSGLVLVALFALQNQVMSGHLTQFQFNPYAILSLIPFAANAVVLWFLVRHPSRTDERVWLGLFLMCICIWSLAEGFQRMSVLPDAGLFWATLTGILNVFASAGIYLFAMAYTGRSEERYTGTIVVVLMTAAILAFFNCYTELLYQQSASFVHLYPWGYNNDPGTGFGALALWMNLMYVLAVIRLMKFRHASSNPILRKQSLIFIIAMGVPTIVGTITDGVLPALGVNVLPPIIMLLTTATAITLSYAMARYKMLTINPVLFSETILSIIHEAVIVTDDRFTIIYMNPEAEALLGLKGTIGGQRSLMQFLRAGGQMQALKATFETAPGTPPQPLEHIDIHGANGRKTPVRITNSHLDVEGLSSYVMVLSDISAELESKNLIERTVRVRTKELHEARAYLVASINSLGQGFLLVDHTGKIEVANEAATHVLMRIGANMETPTIMAMAAPMHWDVQLGDAVEAVLKQRRSRQMHATTETGSFYDLYLTPVLAGDEVIGAAILVEDVTERRVLERSRDEFFSIASHELRTPLTAIRGNASMVKDNLAAPAAKRVYDESEMASMVDDIHTSSIRLTEIVNDFLDSSRLEQGKMLFTPEPTLVKPMLASVREDFEGANTRAGNTLRFEGLDSLPPVYADRTRLRQIIYNLLSNSFKYTTKGTITVSAHTQGKNILIRFSDTGTGITPENQKLLFHKFQQAGGSLLTRDTSKGTGLGLYISRLLGENMGGSLVLEHSAPDEGSTFLLTLPLAVAKPQAEQTIRVRDKS